MGLSTARWAPLGDLGRGFEGGREEILTIWHVEVMLMWLAGAAVGADDRIHKGVNRDSRSRQRG